MRDVQRVTPRDLRGASCATCRPGTPCEDTITLIALCHPRAGNRVRFNKKTGELEVACRVCGLPVVNIVLEATS